MDGQAQYTGKLRVPATGVKTKEYKLVKGSGGGANPNSISIEFIPGRMESVVFVSKVRQKAIDIFGKGMSLDSVGTSYTVNLRYPDYKKNLSIAKMLIKCVELEEALKKIKFEENLSGKKV